MNRLRCITALVVLVAALTALTVAQPQRASASGTAIITSADTYANHGAPTTNFGGSCCLAAGGGAPYAAYLRFTVPSDVTGATLTLSVGSQRFAGSTNGFSVWQVADTWTESTLTWNNRPAVSSTLLGSFTGASINGKVTVPLPSASTLAGRQVTLAVTGGSDDVWFWSREHGPSTAPTLTVTSPPLSDAPSVGVLGDSIVQGCCSSAGATKFIPVAQPFWRVAAQRLGWADPIKDAQGGTGYLARGPADRPPFTERIGPFLDAHPDLQVVMIEGGNCDPTNDPAALSIAVNFTFDTIIAKEPTAKVYIVGPYSPIGSGKLMQRDIIGTAARVHGFVFIDQIAEGWMTGDSDLLWYDHFHPVEGGHDVLGRRLAADITALSP